MIQFQIPKAFISGFETLISLEAEQINKILDFLKSIPVGIGPKTFGELYSKTFTEEPFTKSLASTLFSFGSFKVNQEEKPSQEEIIDGLVQSFKEQSGKEFKSEDYDNLQKNISEILNASLSFSSTFKAFNLLSENSNVYREGHIITDIRLLFQNDLNNSERHGLIIHKLRITAEEDGGPIDYFFSLSNNDLNKLRDQIARAIEKEKLIRNDYEKTVSFINVTD